jgi:hypothetical protein
LKPPTRKGEIGMRLLLQSLVVAVLILAIPSIGSAQLLPNLPEALPSSGAADSAKELDARRAELEKLRRQQIAANAAPADDDQKKQIELLQKQVETLEKQIKLLADQLKKQDVEKLQLQAATLEARSVQAARRDKELSSAIDDLHEHMDFLERYGPMLPSQLKELFLPSGTNETPLSIYGTLVGGYELFPQQRGEGHFFFDALEPIFLLQLNDWILLESELEFHTDGVNVGYAQADFIVSDCLTVVAGRFLTPFGFFNERLHPDWINKMPDFPLMERNVSLADSSLNGVQLRGAKYLFCSPVKMEYSLYAANGFGKTDTDFTNVVNLGAIKDTSTGVNDAMAWGGRIGFWLPEWGVNVGSSLFYSRPYGSENGPHFNMWGVDVNYHKGDWDFHFEYAHSIQWSHNPPAEGDQGDESLAQKFHRRGLYAQIAYRPYQASHRLLANTEYVFRYSRARFGGIDPGALDLTAFESPLDAPVDRDQYAFGINYYFAPSVVLKAAYQINQERGDNLKDDLFLVQLAWGF